MMDKTALYPSVFYRFPHPNGRGMRLWTEAECQKLFHDMKTFNIWRDWTEEYAFQKEHDGRQQAYGMHIVCNVHYPPHLQDQMSSFPLLPTKKHIPRSWLSAVQKKMFDQMHRRDAKNVKIVGCVSDEEGLSLHYLLVQFLLIMGASITRIYSVCEYEQSHYLREIVEFNAKKRAACESPLARNLFKLNRSVFVLMLVYAANRVC